MFFNTDLADQQPIDRLFKVETFAYTASNARHYGWPMQVAGAAAAAQPPTPVLKAGTFKSSVQQAEDTSPPMELRTRNIIARTPVAGPSPASATPTSAPASAGASPILHSTPQSTSHQVGSTTISCPYNASIDTSAVLCPNATSITCNAIQAAKIPV